ncbi:superoxide dismutase [Tepidicaulis sp.]|uniref:superoxide dismutase n=1 Tax=Tepidicaulis sp. TaxID=1920809 RepID=UPI003B59B879
MTFTLPDLPYAKDALEPAMSAKTLEFHHGKHHAGYVKKLNAAIDGTDYAGKDLVDILLAADKKGDTGVFNNAAQSWNHEFFWNCMGPKGGGAPTGKIGAAIEKVFSSADKFREEFVKAGAGRFGSGWVWLVADGDTLKIVSTPNAETPHLKGQTPLLVCDVWEHAYYLDYQNQRDAFLETFLDKLVNWSFVEAQLEATEAGKKLAA